MITIALRKRTLSPVRLVLKVTFSVAICHSRGGSHKAKRYRLKSVISLYRAPNGLKSSKSIAIYIQNSALFSNPVFKVQNEQVFFLGGGWKQERGEA